MRPTREPDFIFTTNRKYKNGRTEQVSNSMYWKEMIAFVKVDIEEYQYDIVVTEFGRIDMRFDNISNSVSWVEGLRESYEQFKIEEILLHD